MSRKSNNQKPIHKNEPHDDSRSDDYTESTECNCKRVSCLQHKYEELLENLQCIMKNLQSSTSDTCSKCNHEMFSNKKDDKSKKKTSSSQSTKNANPSSEDDCSCSDTLEISLDASDECVQNSSDEDCDKNDSSTSNESAWYIIPKMKCTEKTVSKRIEKCDGTKSCNNPVYVKKIKYRKSSC